MEQGACLGIPGITGHRVVHAAGSVTGRIVLVQGGAGAVGLCAVQLAHKAGAYVVATVRSMSDEASVRRAGADEVLLANETLTERVRAIAPNGVDHIVEVAFGANIATDVELLALGGSIATYATNTAEPKIPFWPLVFKNVRLCFLGSDDFPSEMKIEAARDLNAAFEAGWTGFEIAARLPLTEIAKAHELVEQPVRRGRVVLTL
jgi:NADPH2:quinone reductase